jgi:hypothetical protein
MPINPISATLMHTGKVLIVAGSENDASNNNIQLLHQHLHQQLQNILQRHDRVSKGGQ